jgi:hypothetical protein
MRFAVGGARKGWTPAVDHINRPFLCNSVLHFICIASLQDRVLTQAIDRLILTSEGQSSEPGRCMFNTGTWSQIKYLPDYVFRYRIPFYPGFCVFLSFQIHTAKKIAPRVSKYAKGWTNMKLFRFPARKCISLYFKGFKPTLGPTLLFIQGVRGLKRPDVHLCLVSQPFYVPSHRAQTTLLLSLTFCAVIYIYIYIYIYIHTHTSLETGWQKILTWNFVSMRMSVSALKFDHFYIQLVSVNSLMFF